MSHDILSLNSHVHPCPMIWNYHVPQEKSINHYLKVSQNGTSSILIGFSIHKPSIVGSIHIKTSCRALRAPSRASLRARLFRASCSGCSVRADRRRWSSVPGFPGLDLPGIYGNGMLPSGKLTCWAWKWQYEWEIYGVIMKIHQKWRCYMVLCGKIMGIWVGYTLWLWLT